ncbi:TetM/TetW/TetO/TetS family tetracycline resistance ribosomal protection protein, partial [Candidatus Woesearchaeota archaeon]|nr:TetM/TetW/TetO/TetS family tetracycline resistance ribosomal protection protein [Candidatus Woesearchaeota archaeon]
MAKRNIAIVGFTDSGKTTIADLLSFLSPDDTREYRGSIERGNTLTDTGRVEMKRGITIHTVPFMRRYSFGGKSFQVNFIDTPGHPEFAYQVSVGLQAAEGAIFLVDAQQGFRYHAASLLQQIRAAKLPVIVAINKLDSLSPADFNKSVEGICLSALGYGFRFNALQEYTPFGSLDDRVFGEVNMDDSKDPLPALENRNPDLTSDGSIPALFTSGKMAIGVKELLAYAIHHFPGPEQNRLYQNIPDEHEGSFSAQLMNCFPKGNQWMTPVRVFSGTLKRGERVRNQTTGKYHRLGEIYAPDGITLLSSVSTGDIFLLRNPPDGATAGDTLLRPSQHLKEFSFVKLPPPKRS